MADWAQQGNVEVVAGRLESDWHLIAERGDLFDRAFLINPQHAVVVRVGHEEPAVVRLHGEVHAGVDNERRLWWVVDRPLAEVRDEFRCAVGLNAV